MQLQSASNHFQLLIYAGLNWPETENSQSKELCRFSKMSQTFPVRMLSLFMHCTSTLSTLSRAARKDIWILFRKLFPTSSALLYLKWRARGHPCVPDMQAKWHSYYFSENALARHEHYHRTIISSCINWTYCKHAWWVDDLNSCIQEMKWGRSSRKHIHHKLGSSKYLSSNPSDMKEANDLFH